MFCPKCGSKLPDGAKFCGNCGAAIGGSQPSTAATTVPKTEVTSENVSGPKTAASHLDKNSKTVQLNPAGGVTVGGKHFTNAQVIVLVCAVLAIICALLPWVNTSASDYQASQYISDGLNGLSSLTGGDGTAGAAYRLKESYAMWELPQMARAYSGYGAGSMTGITEILIIWAVGLLSFALGVFRYIRYGGHRLTTIIGGIVLGFLPVALIQQGSRSGDGTPIWPMLCLVFIVATILCEFLLAKPVTKSKAKRGK